jgi:uncharacterized membrane protein YkoI
MIRKVALPALLAAAAFALTPVAFAAPDSNTSASTVTTTLSPPLAGQSAPGAQPSVSKPTVAGASAMAPATQQAGQTVATAALPAGASPKPAVRYVRFLDRVNREDIAAFGAAKIPLAQAMEKAARDMHGVVVEAVFKADPSKPHYVVWVMEHGRVLTAYVDPETGQVTRLRRAIATHRLYPSERRDFEATAKATMTLPEAAFFASKHTGGAPISAALERVDRTDGYQIAFVDKKTGRMQEIWVSPNNPPMPIPE